MKRKDGEQSLDEALDFVAREARYNVIDALFATLHNAAGTLEGNTEESDVEWFADFLARGDNRLFSGLEEKDQEEYRRRAFRTLEALPYLMDRIANRYRTRATVLHDMMKAHWRERIGK